MKKIAVNTLGCKNNQIESSIIKEDFISIGYDVVDFNDVADIYIINTCSVTEKSDKTAKYFIRQAKRANPEAKIIVTGCYAQVAAQELEKLGDVNLVLGNVEKHKMLDYIKYLKEDNKVHVRDIMEHQVFDFDKFASHSGRTRSFLKIQDGCNNRCTYCIIPYARGKSRSNKPENIINEINSLTAKGFKEIVITGIHLGQWGLDFESGHSLYDLIKEIEKINDLKRYRIGSLNPTEFDDELINVLAGSEKFCRHLHISLQSANNDILNAMQRGYTVEMYTDLIHKLKENMPDLAIGCDIIVGFPGETDEMFEQTYEHLKQLPISYLHVFSYSRRKGTPAYDMSNQVPHEVKKQRNKILTELAAQKGSEFKQSFIDKEMEILIEKSRDKATGRLKGLTGNYISVLIDAKDDLINEVVKVKITDISGDNLVGEII